MRSLNIAVLAATIIVPLSNAQASVLGGLVGGANSLGSPVLNLLDDSRDVFVDVNSDGAIGAGDILFGVVQIDSTNPPSIDANNQIYAVFSQTFGDDFAIDPGDGTASGSFVPTTEAGFTLSDLTGQSVDSSAFVAVFEQAGGFSIDIDSLNAGDIVLGVAIDTPEEVITSIATEGDFILSAGFRDGPGGLTDGPFDLPDTGDFFVFETEVPLAAVEGPAIDGLFGPNPIVLGNFGAGLSVLDNSIAIDPLDILVGFSGVGPGGNTFAEVTVGGNFSSGGGGPVNGIFPISNSADFSLGANAIPEPTTLLVWGGLLSTFGIVVRRRIAA